MTTFLDDDTIVTSHRYMPRSFINRGTLRDLVAGLRDDAPPSAVRVYDMNGKLLRIEQPKPVRTKFNNRG